MSKKKKNIITAILLVLFMIFLFCLQGPSAMRRVPNVILFIWGVPAGRVLVLD